MVMEKNSEYEFNKVLGENEKKCLFLFKKIKGTFWPTQIYNLNELMGRTKAFPPPSGCWMKEQGAVISIIFGYFSVQQ